MFCPNCGAQLPDGSSFCGNCGANFNDSANSNHTPETKQESPVEKIISFIRSNIVTVAAAAIVIVVLIIILSACGGKGYEKVAVKFAKASSELDYKTIEKLAPFKYDKMMDDLVEEACDAQDMTKKEFFEELEDEMDIKVKKSSDILPAMFDYMKEEYEDAFDDRKIKKVTVDDTDKLDKDDIEELVEDLEDSFDAMGLDADDYIKTKKIKKAYTVELEIEYKDKDLDESTMEVTVVKYGGKWKVLDAMALDILNMGF